MLHAYTARFDVTENLENFLDFGGTKQGPSNNRCWCQRQKKKREIQEEPMVVLMALFSSKIFCKMDTVAFSFVFDKHCPIMD